MGDGVKQIEFIKKEMTRLLKRGLKTSETSPLGENN